jgi:hypothetical protein
MAELVDFAPIAVPDIAEQERQRRADFIQGLRECADFMERHPLIPTPYGHAINAFVNTKEQLAAIARSTSWAKGYDDNYFWLKKTFSGDITLEVNTNRERICRRVVVGTKVIPAQPEKVVEQVEWVCDEGLLSDVVNGTGESR